jgi:hypothetical protein
MSHVRQQIRDALVTTLTGLTTTGANVFASRPQTRMLPATSLPALMIYTVEESSERASLPFQYQLQRTLTVAVEARAQATADLDDTLDTICAEVEAAINASESAHTCGGKCEGISLTATSIDFEDDAEQPIGRAVMTWVTDYFTAADAPQTAT